MSDSNDLTKLNPEAFQKLVNELATQVLGLGVTGFGPGSDGGRDGYFRGEAPYPSMTEKWNGDWHIQSKFHRPNLSKNSQTWLLAQIRKEIKEYTRPGTRRKWPNNWIIATNIVPSGTPRTGTFDKATAIVRNVRPELNFDIWGGDKILDLLKSHPTVARGYTGFLTSSEALAEVIEDVRDRRQPARPRRSQKSLTQIFSGCALVLISLVVVAIAIAFRETVVAYSEILTPPSLIGIVAALTTLPLGFSLIWWGFSAGPSPPAATALIVNPEQHATHLVGREKDVHELLNCLNQNCLVFLSGESGVGKSTLVKVGLLNCLKTTRSTLLPIVVDGYGAADDWDNGLSANVASQLAKALTDEECVQLGFSDRNCSAEQLMERLRDRGSKLCRVPLLVFDQFDEYQHNHRGEFLCDGQWITPATLVARNKFWRAIQEALEQRILKVLLVTRRDRFDPLDSLRLVAPAPRLLVGILGSAVRELLDVLLRGAAREPADLDPLKNALVNDLTDEGGEVLPIKAALAFQGLALLDELTLRCYERSGRLEGLLIRHVKRGHLRFAELLRIDRKAACAFFGRMVKHDTPPTTDPVPIKELAKVVNRDDSQVRVALELFDKDTFCIVRKRIDGTGSQEAAWSLYHPFLASLVLEVQREWDSATALLETKYRAYCAIGWRNVPAKLMSLLSPWGSIRLAWAIVRRRVSWRTYGSYLGVSALCIVCIAVVLGLVFVRGRHVYRDVTARGEAQAICAAIAAVEDLSKPPIGGELKQLEALARADWNVKDRVIRTLVEFPMPPRRFALRVEYLLHAIVGIDPVHQRRTQVLATLADLPAGTTANGLAIRGLWRARIIASDPVHFASAATLAGDDLVQAIQSTTTRDDLQELEQALLRVAASIDEHSSAPLANAILTAMQPESASPEQLGSLARGLAGLKDKVNASFCAQAARIIVTALDAMDAANDDDTLATALAALSESIDSTDLCSGTHLVVNQILGQRGFLIDSAPLKRALDTLVAHVPPDHAADLADQIIEAMAAANNHVTARSVASALSHLAQITPPERCTPLARQLVEVISQNALHFDVRDSFVPALPVFSARINEESAPDLAEDLLQIMRQPASGYSLYYIASTLVQLADRIEDDRKAALAEAIVDTMRLTGEKRIEPLDQPTTNASRQAVMCRVLAAFTGPTDSLRDEAAEILADTLSVHDLSELAHGLSLLVEIDDPRLNAAAARIVEVLETGENESTAKTLAERLAALEGKSDPQFINQAARRLVTLIQQVPQRRDFLGGDRDVRRALASIRSSGARQSELDVVYVTILANALNHLALRCDPELTGQAATLLIDRIEGRDVNSENAMANFAVLVRLVSPGQRSRIARRLLKEMRATDDPIKLDALAGALAGAVDAKDTTISEAADRLAEVIKGPILSDHLILLARRLAGLVNVDDPRRAAAAKRIVQAMQNTESHAELRDLAQGLVAVADEASMDPGRRRILAVMGSMTDPADLWELAEGAAALAEKSEPKFSHEVAAIVVKAMQNATSYNVFYGLAVILCELRQVRSAALAQDVVDLLKHPLALGSKEVPNTLDSSGNAQSRPKKRVMDCLLVYLGRGLGSEPFPDLQSLVDWLQVHPEVKLDLESPTSVRLRLETANDFRLRQYPPGTFG